MKVGPLLSVALVINVLALVVCTADATQATSRSKPAKCRKVKKCPKNEEFSYCPQSIQRAQYCSEKAEPSSSCKAKSEKPCKEGCVCKENYLRTRNGTCIPERQCPLTCADNEVLDDCPSYCESDYCPTSEEDTFAKPCFPQNVCPPPICKCGFNRHRAANGTCILTRDCPPFNCTSRPYEEYNPCPPLCPTDDCSQASPTGECPPQFGRIGIILPCNPKCRCIKGYWRLNGTCVSYGECPGVCPDKERYSTCIQAECRALNCTQKDQSVPCVRMDPEFCEKGCVCQEGYLRNQDGMCVLEEKCKPPLTCADNEVLDNCPSYCESDKCPATEADTYAKPCVPQEGCPPPACKCAFNHRRAANGSCIPTRDCPPFNCTTRSNEEYNPCPPLCPTDDCSQASPTGECPPQFGRIGIILPCNPKCRCIKGYWRLNGTCVPYGECPTCKANEEFVPCIQGVCRAKYCSERGQDVPCPDIPTEKCDSGCICKEGFLRAENGTCILEDKCETCGENEVLDNCPTTCNTDYCPKSADEKQVCTKADPCVPACKCRFNYKRAANKTCIPTRDCPPFDCSSKPNEKYDACPPLCPTDACYKPRLDGRCPFRIGILLQCQPKCQCKDGYGRENGTCVPFEKCSNLCPTKEEYSPCVQKTCRPQSCADRDLAMQTCPTCDAAECKRGCVCQKNYYRNDTGVCVSYKECAGLKCTNAHEVYEPNYSKCTNTCNSLVAKFKCDENEIVGPGCRCEDGYLRLNETEGCVRLCDCPEMKYSPECSK